MIITHILSNKLIKIYILAVSSLKQILVHLNNDFKSVKLLCHWGQHRNHSIIGIIKGKH